MYKKEEALRIVEEGLKELESQKGSITVAVQKLSRASNLLEEKNYYIWAEIELGNEKYIEPLKELVSKILDEAQHGKSINLSDQTYKDLLETLTKVDIDIKFLCTTNFLLQKTNSGTGGLNKSIHHLEEHLPYLKKHGNDKTLYLNNVQERLAYVKGKCHKYLTDLYNRLKFSGTVASGFDLLKNAVDDKLLDLDPEIAEQLMLAFRSVSSDSKEEWSQALATCRRLLESLADILYPPTDENINGRTFKQNQYINRIWRFMDVAIESKSNKDMAKAHLDYLGSWMAADYTLTCKGVHTEVSQLEATKAIFHIYLMLADLLEYLNIDPQNRTTQPLITEVSLDEIEALLNVKRDVAKAIIVARVKNKGLTVKQLSEVQGVGSKTIEKAKEVFTF